MTICVYQGTFNPIHNAHIRVAKYVLEKNIASKVIFVPAFIPPHKSIQEDNAIHRLAMVTLATEDIPKFEVSDIEFKKNDISYTYLTIKELYKSLDIKEKINFIIGTDAFEKIETWYKTDKLKNLVHFIIFLREDSFNKSRFDYLKEKGYDFEFQELTFENISSSEIRKRIFNNEKITNMIPKKVEEYIKKYDLYRKQN